MTIGDWEVTLAVGHDPNIWIFGPCYFRELGRRTFALCVGPFAIYVEAEKIRL